MKPGDTIDGRRLYAALSWDGAGDRAELPRGALALRRLARRQQAFRSRHRSASTPRDKARRPKRRSGRLGFSQLYLSLGDRMDNGAQAVRASYKPLVTLIWLGALVMAFGGALSLSDRRLRVGAPRRARRAQGGRGGDG